MEIYKKLYIREKILYKYLKEGGTTSARSTSVQDTTIFLYLLNKIISELYTKLVKEQLEILLEIRTFVLLKMKLTTNPSYYKLVSESTKYKQLELLFIPINTALMSFTETKPLMEKFNLLKMKQESLFYLSEMSEEQTLAALDFFHNKVIEDIIYNNRNIFLSYFQKEKENKYNSIVKIETNNELLKSFILVNKL